MFATMFLVMVMAAGGELQGSKPDPGFTPDPAWKPLGKDKKLWFDRENHRLVLRARISVQDGPLEHLMCLDRTKEHEAILVTEAIPKQIHAGLLLCGAKPGGTVKYKPEFKPPAGTPIRIAIEWTENGKTQKADARDWVKDEKTGKTLTHDWVFAGSELFEDPRTKEMIYLADDGDVITVSNFSSSLLDLPFASSANDAERMWAANSKKIPPRETWVTVFLTPLLDEKSKPEPKAEEKTKKTQSPEPK